MAESSVYSVRIPEEIKEKLNRLIEESERSPSDFFARMINTHEIESVGRAELDDARKLFARVEEIISSLMTRKNDAETDKVAAAAAYLSEIETLTTQLKTADEINAALTAAAAADHAAAAAQIEKLQTELDATKAAATAAAAMQTELATTVREQREQIAALTARAAATAAAPITKPKLPKKP